MAFFGVDFILQNFARVKKMTNIRYVQTYQTKPDKQTYQTKSNVAYQAYWTKTTKPKLLVKAFNPWVRSAFGNVSFYQYLFLGHPVEIDDINAKVQV